MSFPVCDLIQLALAPSELMSWMRVQCSIHYSFLSVAQASIIDAVALFRVARCNMATPGDASVSYVPASMVFCSREPLHGIKPRLFAQEMPLAKRSYQLRINRMGY